jgi:hypothetical protein
MAFRESFCISATNSFGVKKLTCNPAASERVKDSPSPFAPQPVRFHEQGKSGSLKSGVKMVNSGKGCRLMRTSVAAILEQEFSHAFHVGEFIDLPKFQVLMKLAIDGRASW